MQDLIQHIWDDFHHELHRFILKKVKLASVADDLLQETFLKVMQQIDKVQAAHNMQHYLFRISSNVVIDYFRAKKKEATLSDEAVFSEEESTNLNEVIAACCIKPFLGQLPPKYRDALSATELEGLSQKELAQQLNISYSGAKSRVQRGKDKLKAIILDCCAYESDRYGNLMSDTSDTCACPAS